MNSRRNFLKGLGAVGIIAAAPTIITSSKKILWCGDAMVAPDPVSPYDEFMGRITRNISEASGLSYEELTKAYSNTYYRQLMPQRDLLMESRARREEELMRGMAQTTDRFSQPFHRIASETVIGDEVIWKKGGVTIAWNQPDANPVSDLEKWMVSYDSPGGEIKNLDQWQSDMQSAWTVFTGEET